MQLLRKGLPACLTRAGSHEPSWHVGLGRRPVEVLRKESLAGLAPSAACRVLSHAYAAVVPIAPLPYPPLPLSPNTPGQPPNTPGVANIRQRAGLESSFDEHLPQQLLAHTCLTLATLE